MIKIKKSLLKSLLVALSLVFVLPMTAYANHQGTQTTYGHFGQPHGYIISGDFTFIVEVHGKVDRVIFNIVNAKTNKIVADYNVNTPTTYYNGDSYYNLNWNSTGFDDGEYQLGADIQVDAGNGWTDFVKHYAGQTYLGFTVKNPDVTVPPVTQPPESTCSEKLEQANKLTTKVYNRHKKNFDYIDKFMQQVTLFASSHSDENYDVELKKTSETRKASSDLLLELEGLKNINCDNSLKEQVSNFVVKSALTRNSLDTYKDSVINFILTVIGDLK